MTLLLLLTIPAIIAVAGYFLGKGKITWKEFGVQFGVVVIIMAAGYFLGRCGATRDVEVWNGRVAEKHKGTESCCHSYPCNCREECSGSGKNKSCSTVCDTCYLHSEDEYWSASSTNRENIYYNGCNSPGSSTPVRWARIVVGEPTAVEHSFTNYIKAAPDSLFTKHGLIERYKKYIPRYPRVYDHYRINRALFVNINEPKLGQINKRLSKINADLGKRKQVNIILVVVKSADRGMIHGLEEAWLGGKKNDLVLVIGAPKYPSISWVGVMSWTKQEMLKLTLRDKIESMGVFDSKKILSLVEKEVESKFVRRQMSDFKYLSASIEPPFWLLITLFIIGIIVSGVLQIYFWREDPFGNPNAPRRYYRRY